MVENRVEDLNLKGEFLKMAKSFSQAKLEFDNKNQTSKEFNIFLPEHLILTKKTLLQKKDGSYNEQYYKWQLFYALVHSGMYAKDYIGTEIYFPKGNKNSAPIKFDGAIFDDVNWFEYYKDYHVKKNQESLDWLRKHLIAVIEIKKENNKDIEAIWNQQLKPALKGNYILFYTAHKNEINSNPYKV